LLQKGERMADPIPTPPNPCQGGWLCFLNSIATPGGNLFLLFALLCLFIPTMILLMIRFGPGAPVVITIVAITSGFAGAITTRMNSEVHAGQHTRASDAPAPEAPKP
jgi:hypothetical protein